MRNKIYDYCIEVDPGVLKRSGQILFLKPKTVHRFDYLALTQVCKQRRAEFRPLYMKNTKILVSVEEVSWYLDVFFPPCTSDQLHQPTVTLQLT